MFNKKQNSLVDLRSGDLDLETNTSKNTFLSLN